MYGKQSGTQCNAEKMLGTLRTVVRLLFARKNVEDEVYEDEGDTPFHVDVDAHEVVQLLGDFEAGARKMKMAFDVADSRARRQRDSVLRNTTCVEELEREWMHNASIMQDFSNFKELLINMKETSVTSMHEAEELQDELSAMKDACVRGMSILHRIIVLLQTPEHDSRGFGSMFAPPTEPPRETRPVLPSVPSDADLGFLDAVFSTDPIAPTLSYNPDIISQLSDRELHDHITSMYEQVDGSYVPLTSVADTLQIEYRLQVKPTTECLREMLMSKGYPVQGTEPALSIMLGWRPKAGRDTC